MSAQGYRPEKYARLGSVQAYFGRPLDSAVDSAFLWTTSILRQIASKDSHTSFQLFALFCSSAESPSSDPSVQQYLNCSNYSPL